MSTNPPAPTPTAETRQSIELVETWESPCFPHSLADGRSHQWASATPRGWVCMNCEAFSAQRPSAHDYRTAYLAALTRPVETPPVSLTHAILEAQGRVADMILQKTGRMAVGLDDWAKIDALCVAVAAACGRVLQRSGTGGRMPE